MSGFVSYVFYAIDKPLSRTERAEVARLSRRANPDGAPRRFLVQRGRVRAPGPIRIIARQVL